MKFFARAIVESIAEPPRGAGWKPVVGRCPRLAAICHAVVVAVTLSLCPAIFAHATETMGRADDVFIASFFSFREAAQIHSTAHALGMASINGTPSEEVVEKCDGDIKTLRTISMPILRRYLSKVEHDEPTRTFFEGVQETQQIVLGELEAVKAMAESGNKPAERLAFVAANRRYNEVVEPLLASLFNPAKKNGRETGEGGSTVSGDGSPNERLFSHEAWRAIVAGLQKRGLLGGANDARDYFGVFVALKSVFVAKRIPEPSTAQLFGLAKLLNLPFESMKPEAVEVTLRQMLENAEAINMEVASREALLRLGE